MEAPEEDGFRWLPCVHASVRLSQTVTLAKSPALVGSRVNHRRPWWIVFSLLPLLIGLCALVVPFGSVAAIVRRRRRCPPMPTWRWPSSDRSDRNFQSILLNISGVRINKLVDAATNSPGWTTIAVPPQAGSGNGQKPGDLQIDLLHTQTAATIYNVAERRRGSTTRCKCWWTRPNRGPSYRPANRANSNTEGCTNYRMQFSATTSSRSSSRSRPHSV